MSGRTSNLPPRKKAISRENIRRLHDAIDALPAPLRGAIALARDEGLSSGDLASDGISVNAVRVRSTARESG